MQQVEEITKKTVLTMGEAAIRCDAGEIICFGLGSCVGVFLYDKFKKIGGGAHIMLPSNEKRPESDQLIMNIVNTMISKGSHYLAIRARLVGGAEIFNVSTFHIGDRNIDYLRQKLKKMRILIIAEDLGGNESRTARLNIATGELSVNNSKKDNYTI